MCSLFLSLCGCSSLAGSYHRYMSDAALAGKDTCGKRYLSRYVGTPFDDVNVSDILPDKYKYRVADPRIELLPNTDSVFTTDLKYNRMSIYVSDVGNIEKLQCG